MKFPLYCTAIASAMLLAIPAALPAQQAVLTTSPVSVVPHLIKYSGALPSAPGKASTVDVKFALYAAPTGGEALWSETQQVALDSAGKYAVLLGSVATLPNAAFANGAARWIGVTLSGQEESARTILVATPYSLKASDAETLSGHPITDFALKNAQPASGTNITQINVTNGVTGGGTGPTVTLGLSSTYLENLGDEIYPQLTGTNTLTGKNTYTAGKLLLGTSPVLSAANVLGTSPVTATVSGNTVKIGLSDSALLTLGNGVYAQLGAANTFTTGQSINTSMNDGVLSQDSAADEAAVFGEDQSSNASGVTGVGDVGVYGYSNGGLNFNIGTFGDFAQQSGEYGSTSTSQSGNGFGVWGDGGGTGTYAFGVVGTTDTANAVAGYTASYYAAIYAQSDYASGASGGYIFGAVSSVTGDQCLIDNSANFSCDGSFSVTNMTTDQHRVETYAVQSSEEWIEDFGSGQMENGHAVVTLDPTFAKIVNAGVGYHVFLTPNGDSKGLYVTSRGPASFEVKESANGNSALSFDYRIVAKRLGKESSRLTDVTQKRISSPATPGLLARDRAVVKRPMPTMLGGMKIPHSAAKPQQP